MSYSIYRAQQRGQAEHGWLHARFSFSFADYYDPKRVGFGALRVLNNDTIEPDSGFEMHPHENMEIITIILKGSLEHKDSKGNHGIIKEGEVQYMSAAEGVYHSEKNPSKTQSVELFQIWIYPNVKGGEPRYREFDLHSINKIDAWSTVASPDGRDGSIEIRQNAFLYTTTLQKGSSIELENLDESRGIFLMVVEGSVEIEGDILGRRDELQIQERSRYSLKAHEQSKLMMFDLPMNPKS